jgi:hypothetical protein
MQTETSLSIPYNNVQESYGKYIIIEEQSNKTDIKSNVVNFIEYKRSVRNTAIKTKQAYNKNETLNMSASSLYAFSMQWPFIKNTAIKTEQALNWYKLFNMPYIFDAFSIQMSSMQLTSMLLPQPMRNTSNLSFSSLIEPLLIEDIGWSTEEALETRMRLHTFEEDWNALGMEAYDCL